MKKEISICAKLGITQQEMASLLGISRSLWSMHERGRRELPAKAMSILYDLERQVYLHTEKIAKAAEMDKATEMPDSTRKAFENQLNETERQLRKLDRKIADTGKNQRAMVRLTHFSTVLSDSDHRKAVMPLANWIAVKADIATERNPPAILAMLEHRKEILEYELKVLKSKLSPS